MLWVKLQARGRYYLIEPVHGTAAGFAERQVSGRVLTEWLHQVSVFLDAVNAVFVGMEAGFAHRYGQHVLGHKASCSEGFIGRRVWCRSIEWLG